MTTLSPASPPMKMSRLARAYYTEARYETIRMLRAPAFVFPTLCLPIGLYLLLGLAIFRNIADPRLAIAFFTGFATFAVVGPGMFGFGIALAQERHLGVLTLKRALPMPPAAYLLAKMLMALLFAAIVMTTIATIVYWAGRLPGLSPLQLLRMGMVYVVGAIPFCAIGLLIGSVANGPAAPAVVNIVYFPMMYLSGLFFPLTPTLQKIAPVWPAYHLNRTVLSLLGVAPESPLTHVAVLVTVTIVCTGLAVRRLSRVG